MTEKLEGNLSRLEIPQLNTSIEQLKSSLLLFFRRKYIGEKKFTLSKLGIINGKTYDITISVKEYSK